MNQIPNPKFKSGDAVIIKLRLVGIVIASSYFMNAHWLYRIVVDAKDSIYRITNNNENEPQEDYVFDEDINQLRYHTEQLALFETFEEDLKPLEA